VCLWHIPHPAALLTNFGSIECMYYICTYVCTYICMYVHITDVYMYVYRYICVCVCIRVCMYLYMYVNMYLYTYVFIYARTYTYVSMYVRIYICLFVCIYVCITYVRALRRHHILLLLIKATNRSDKHLNIFSINTKSQPFCLLCLYRADCSWIGVQVCQCHSRGERNLGRPKKRWSEE